MGYRGGKERRRKGGRGKKKRERERETIKRATLFARPASRQSETPSFPPPRGTIYHFTFFFITLWRVYMVPIFSGYRRRKHVTDASSVMTVEHWFISIRGHNLSSCRRKFNSHEYLSRSPHAKQFPYFFFRLDSSFSSPSPLSLSLSLSLSSRMLALLLSPICASTNKGVMYFHVQNLGRALDSVIKNVITRKII